MDATGCRKETLYTSTSLRGSDFKLRDGSRGDAVLPFYILVEKCMHGHVFYDHKHVGEIEFSVEVQGEIPPDTSEN